MALEFIEGPVMYAKVFEGNRDRTGYKGSYEKFDGMYTIMVGVPTRGDDYKKIMKWNTAYRPKSIEATDRWAEDNYEEKGAVPGMSYFTFKRKHNHVTNAGKVIEEWGGPPRVVDSDGKTLWDPKKLIGNGSTCTVKLDVYLPEGAENAFVRLEGIRVDNHVPAPEKENSQDDNSDVNDDIPF